MTDTPSYGAVLAANAKAARARLGIKQSSCAHRMQELGFDWHPQTVGNVERGERRLTAEEILGLSGALETSVAALLTPPPELQFVTLASGAVVQARSVTRSVVLQRNDGWVRWEGDDPQWFGEKREPTRDEIIAEGEASLRAEGGTWEDAAMRMAGLAVQIADRDRQIAELRGKLSGRSEPEGSGR